MKRLAVVLVLLFFSGIGFSQVKKEVSLLPNQKFIVVPVSLSWEKGKAVDGTIRSETTGISRTDGQKEETFVLLNIETGKCFIYRRDYSDNVSMGYFEEILPLEWDIKGLTMPYMELHGLDMKGAKTVPKK